MGASSDCNGGETGSKPTKGLTETRYIFVLMTFLGTVLAIADRMALNVAIVGMVDRCKMHLKVGSLEMVDKIIWSKQHLLK